MQMALSLVDGAVTYYHYEALVQVLEKAHKQFYRQTLH